MRKRTVGNNGQQWDTRDCNAPALPPALARALETAEQHYREQAFADGRRAGLAEAIALAGAAMPVWVRVVLVERVRAA